MAANILTTYSPHNVQGRPDPEQLATQGYLFSLDHVATISSPAPLVNEGGGFIRPLTKYCMIAIATQTLQQMEDTYYLQGMYMMVD